MFLVPVKILTQISVVDVSVEKWIFFKSPLVFIAYHASATHFNVYEYGSLESEKRRIFLPTRNLVGRRNSMEIWPRQTDGSVVYVFIKDGKI